jgi:molybdopterin converting factor small subunit
MHVHVRLYANFRIGRFKEELREYPPGTTIRKVLEDLEIKEPEIGTLWVDFKFATIDQELHEGSNLGIFPMVGGG